MNIFSTYSVKIKEYRRIFKESVELYRSAVDFFITVCLSEWDSFSSIVTSQSDYTKLMETLTVPTTNRTEVVYNFNTKFYKMPCYLRRAAISEAIGKVSSYESNLFNW